MVSGDYQEKIQEQIMNRDAKAAEKAEFVQSVKALFIPLAAFLACVIMAAGTFLIYNNESVGWVFVAVSTVLVISSFAALIRFQNKHRARGIIRSNIEEELLVFDPELGVGATPQPAASKNAPVISAPSPVASAK
jgi:hypothetical protein